MDLTIDLVSYRKIRRQAERSQQGPTADLPPQMDNQGQPEGRSGVLGNIPGGGTSSPSCIETPHFQGKRGNR